MAHASKSKRSAAPSKKRPAPHPKTPAKAPAKGSSSKASASKPAPKPPARPAEKGGSSAPAAPPPAPVNPNARRHILSLSFLRDGDEFMARLETDGGQITEMKNRSLDQLLTLVAGELEDLLE
jgi:hypothetical protein